AWNLLGMLFIQHGVMAGMVVFREENFDLFYDALHYSKEHKNATKYLLFTHIMESIEHHLNEKEAERQFHKMDLIVKSLNAMKNYNYTNWLTRLEHAMRTQYELVQAME
ncbi:hypothetical protein PMAYCL1PPCAC_09914, partial [Pristionchus mayeri]